MKNTHWLLCGLLSLSLLHTSLAQAWQMRSGGGARTFVVPHNFPQGGGHPQPAPRPMPPGPHPQPHPHPPQPGPHPQPHPEPGPHPYPQPGPGPHPYPPPGPHPYPPPGPHYGPGPYPPGPHPDGWYNPWATAAVIGAVTATAIAIGTYVSSVPADCVSVVANNVAYQHCGPNWYQPRYVGGNVQFVVVPAPW